MEKKGFDFSLCLTSIDPLPLNPEKKKTFQKNKVCAGNKDLQSLPEPRLSRQKR